MTSNFKSEFSVVWNKIIMRLWYVIHCPFSISKIFAFDFESFTECVYAVDCIWIMRHFALVTDAFTFHEKKSDKMALLLVKLIYLKCDSEFPLIGVTSLIIAKGDLHNGWFVSGNLDTRKTVNHLVNDKKQLHLNSENTICLIQTIWYPVWQQDVQLKSLCARVATDFCSAVTLQSSEYCNFSSA